MFFTFLYINDAICDSDGYEQCIRPLPAHLKSNPGGPLCSVLISESGILGPKRIPNAEPWQDDGKRCINAWRVCMLRTCIIACKSMIDFWDMSLTTKLSQWARQGWRSPKEKCSKWFVLKRLNSWNAKKGSSSTQSKEWRRWRRHYRAVQSSLLYNKQHKPSQKSSN